MAPTKFNFARRQRGMSFITLMIVLAIAVFFVLIGIKMVPTYLENYSIREVLASVEKDRSSREMSRRRLRDNILRRLSINGVYNFPSDKIKFTNTKKGLHIAVDYEVRKPIAGNAFVVMVFSESADIPK
jgi:hypothetical protein